MMGGSDGWGWEMGGFGAIGAVLCVMVFRPLNS
jgi:hypothetical protein